MSAAGKVMFWGGIASGSVGILGAIGAIVIVTGSASPAQATAGLISTASSESASSETALVPMSATTTSAKPLHATPEEEHTPIDKAAPAAAPLATPTTNPVVSPAVTSKPAAAPAAPVATATGPQPDLVPARITPGVLDASSPGRFGVIVRNSGTSAARGPFTVRVTVDGRDIYTTNYPGSVSVGGEVLVLIPRFNVPPRGSHKVEVCVDTGGEIKEGNEKNNCAGAPILVR